MTYISCLLLLQHRCCMWREPVLLLSPIFSTMCFCSLALKLTQIRHRTQMYSMYDSFPHSWSSVIPKLKRNKLPLAQTLASYSSQHPCEVGKTPSPFPATGDKAENTAVIPQGSKWRTRKAGNQEFLGPNYLIQKPRCLTPRHY